MKPEIITIADAKTGSRAKLLPAIGMNCYGFSVPAGDAPLEALWAAADFTDGTAKPSGSGIPLLFPFAGRIRGTSFRFEGKEYPLIAGDGLGNAIHGFVINRPWRVAERAADRVVGVFQASVDDSELLKHWPADFRITAEYSVRGQTLTAEYLIENPDDKPLPFGFGTHAYFRVPLGGANADNCQVKVPASYCWDLKELLPTGATSVPEFVPRIAAGMPFGEMKFDTVFGGLEFENHRCTTTIHDPAGGRTLSQTFDDQFTACVVYNPPHRQAVCMEPYTTIPDPFSLQGRDIDPHLKVLAPGESFRTRILIAVT